MLSANLEVTGLYVLVIVIPKYVNGSVTFHGLGGRKMSAGGRVQQVRLILLYYQAASKQALQDTK